MSDFKTQDELFTIWHLSWGQIINKFKIWQKYNLVQRAGEAFGFLKSIKEEKRTSVLSFLDKLPRAKKEGK